MSKKLKSGNDALQTNQNLLESISLLSRLVGGFKRSITLFARDKKLEFDWQSKVAVPNGTSQLSVAKLKENFC